MAISYKGTTTWATSTSTTYTRTLPTHAAGDLLIVRAIRKPFTSPTSMVINTSGWATAGTQYANGSTANGTGVGSMAVCVFWKIATSSSETSPVITWGATAAPGASCALVYQKDASEEWVTPTGVGGIDSTAATTVNDTLGTHISVTSGDMVDFWMGWCDDSGTPSSPSISQPSVTFDTVGVQPSTALDTSTSNDLAAHGGYRLATSGTSSGAATITGSYGSSEQHVVWMTRLRVTTPPGGTFTANAIIKKTVDNRPFVRTVGTAASGTTSLTMTIPASNDGDLLVAFIESPLGSEVPYEDYASLPLQTNGVDWTPAGSAFTSTGVATTETCIWTFVGMKGEFGGTETTAGITFDLATPDHVYGLIVAIGGVGGRDIDWYEHPITGISQWASDTSVTTVYSTDPGNLPEYQIYRNSLFLYAVSNPTDASTARFSAWVPQSTPDSGYLDDTVTEIFDAGTTTGNGGGLGIATAYPSWVTTGGDEWGYWWELAGIQTTQASATAASAGFEVYAPTIQAWLYAWPGFQVDAYIIPIPSFKIDAVISQAPPFRLDAVIFGPRTGTFTVDATLSQAPPFTLDAVIYRRTVESRTEYAYLKANYSGTIYGTANGGSWTYADSSSYIRVGASESGGYTTKWAGVLHFDIPRTVDIYAAAGSDLLRVRAVRLDVAYDQLVLSGVSDLGFYAIADWGGFNFADADVYDTYWGYYTSFYGPRNQAAKLLASSISDDAYTSFDIPFERVLKGINYYNRGSMSLLLAPLPGYLGSGGVPSSAQGYIDLDTTSDLKVRLAIDIGVDFTVDAVIVGPANPPQHAVHAFARAGMGFKNYNTSYYDYSNYTVPSPMGLSAAQLAAAGFQPNDEVLVLWSFRTGEYGDRNGWDLRYGGTSVMDVPTNHYDSGSGNTTNAYARSYMARMSLGGTLSNFATFAKTTTYYEGHINNSDLLVIRLKDFGVEGLDWFWGRSTTDVVHTTTMSSTDRASLTWTPIRVEDWVYAVHIAVDIAQTANSFEWEVDGADGFGLHRSRPVTTEESYNVFRMGFLEDLPASSKTLTIRSRDVGGTTLNSHVGSSILVFRKDRWPDLQYDWTSSDQTISASTDVSVASVSASNSGPTMVAYGGTFTADDARTAWAWTDFERTTPEWEFPGLPAQVQNNSTDRLVLHAHSYTPDFDQSSLTAKVRSSSGSSRTLSGAYLIVWGLRSLPLQYSIDAYIAAGYTRVYGDFDADAIVFGPRSGSWTVSSLKRQTFSGTISVNAFIQPYFRANAVQLTWGAWSDSLGNTYGQAEFELDAIIGKVGAASFTVDATLVATTILGVIYTDATFLAPRAGAFTVDAVLVAAGFTAEGDFTADAILRVSRAGSLDVAATVLGHVQAQRAVDAVLKGTKAGSLGVAATLRGEEVGSFQAAAVITRPASGQFLVAATLLIHREQLYVLDAVKVRTAEGSLGLFAVLKRQAVGSTTVNAVIGITKSGSTHLDALLLRPTVGAATADATIFSPRSGTFPAGAWLSGIFSVRAWLAGRFSVDAFITATASGYLSVDAWIAGPYYADFTSDAIFLATPGGVFDLEATVLRQASDDYTLGAVIRKVNTSSKTLDAVVIKRDAAYGFSVAATTLKTQAGQFAVEATKSAQVHGDWTLDGLIERPTEESFGAWAVVKRGTPGTYRADAVVLVRTDRSVGADAVLKRSATDLFLVGAVVVRAQAGQYALDAIVKRVALGSLAANAVLYGPRTGSFAVNARIMPVFSVDAAVLAHQSASFTASAVIMPRFSVDAIVRKVPAGTFRVDAWVEGAGVAAFAADAVLLRPQTPVGHRVDAVVLALGSDAFDVDGTVLATQHGSFSSDAVKRATESGGLVLEAVVLGMAQGSLPVDAVIEAPQNASTPADAILLAHRAGMWAVDASIAGASGGYIALDAIITRTASATISASAVIGKTSLGGFSGSALLKTVTQASFAADAVIEATRTGGVATDAVFLSPQTSSFSLDAVFIPGVGSGSFPLEAVLGRPYQATFAADAILLSAGSGDFTAGATIGIIPTAAFSADATISSARSGALTLDAITLTQGAGLFGVDASISLHITQEIEATLSAATIAATVAAGTLDATPSAATYASATTAATIDFTWLFARRNIFRIDAALAGAFTLDAEVT